MEYDPCDQLDSLATQMKQAIENIKQQKRKDEKVWQQKLVDLQAQINSLQAQLAESVNSNYRLSEELKEANKENEKLRNLNSQLSKQLHEKEQEVHRFNALSQSLRAMLDDTQPQQQPISPIPQANQQIPFQSFQQPSYQYKVGSSNFQPNQNPQFTSHSTVIDNEGDVSYGSSSKPTKQQQRGRKSQQFLKAAKEQLSHPDFTKLINAISSYNSRTLDKDSILQIGKELLYDENRDLYNQFTTMIQ